MVQGYFAEQALKALPLLRRRSGHSLVIIYHHNAFTRPSKVLSKLHQAVLSRVDS